MERRVDMRGRVSRLYQAAPLISVVWGASSYCLFSEAQAPTSSLLTLGRLLGRRPRSFLGHVHWGFFPPMGSFGYSDNGRNSAAE